MRRLQQVAWIADYLGDIASDMSVFHRVDDIEAMPGPRFLAFAERLSAYQGALAARLRAGRQEPQQRVTPGARQAPAQGQQRPGYREVPATRAALSADPAFRGIFSFGNAG